MKTRFSTLDIIAILPELKSKLCTGWRVNQVYDCDYKTYLFKLNKSIVQMKKDDDPVGIDEETANKMTFIIESGLRMHTTDYDWPKSHAPNSFATKLRKYLRNKRVEDIRQIGIDRLIDLQFGTNVAANHLIVELYDRGNLILTDNNYTILAILRWRKPNSTENPNKPDDDDTQKVGDVYCLEKCRKLEDLDPMTEEKVAEMLNNSKMILGSNQNYKKRNKAKQQDDSDFQDINLKNLLNPYVIYGGSLLEDRLLSRIYGENKSKKNCVIRIPLDQKGNLDQEKVRDYAKLICSALIDAESTLNEVRDKGKSSGYIVQKRQNSGPARGATTVNTKNDDQTKSLTTNVDFFPILTCAKRKIDQESEDLTYQEYDSFDKAVDVYYCNLESQRIDSQAFTAEKGARKKLENLKLAQEKRLEDLSRTQKDDEEKARLIELNCDKVENALLIIRSMLANQVSWSDIWTTIREAQSMKDPIASLITGVKFDRNEFTMRLKDPYDVDSDGDNQEVDEPVKKSKIKQVKSKYKNVDIDISLSAHANARRFFVKRRTAVNKEKKTIEVSKKALKNVERRTKEMLKEVVVKTNITKARKRYWFENFFWFISSDGYLVVAGRDAEQNELLVKRYMKNNDIYVHADLHGASTVIIKNEVSQPVPPKTLTEAGSMAVCYSSAWDSKIATTSWWVYPKQVSKTAPAGEYLTVGAFIIRGKKNYLPLSNLVLGFGFLFRLGEESIDRRKEERAQREHSNLPMNSLNPQSKDEEKSSDSEHEDQPLPEISSSDSESLENEPNSEQSAPVVSDANLTSEVIKNDEQIEEEDDFLDEDNKNTEHKLIDTLAESPAIDDVLLYAIPMCGPYSALQSFKYKVKVIPGANKRGKAAKACLGMFLYDKRASQRERDLLRALKDQDFARNIPNKVKISAANMKSAAKTKKNKKQAAKNE